MKEDLFINIQAKTWLRRRRGINKRKDEKNDSNMAKKGNSFIKFVFKSKLRKDACAIGERWRVYKNSHH